MSTRRAKKNSEKTAGPVQRIVLHPDHCPVDKSDQIAIRVRGERLTDPVLERLALALRKALADAGYEIVT